MDEEKLQDIRKRAELVRAATEPGENTAERVGSVLVDTVDAVGTLEDETRSALDGKASTEELHTLSTKVGGLPTKTDVDAALAAKADLEDGNVPTSQLGNVAAIADERIKAKEKESYFSVRFVPVQIDEDTVFNGTVDINGQTYEGEGRKKMTFYETPTTLEINGLVSWIDVSRLDTSKLTKTRIFGDMCVKAFADFDVGGWDTSNVTDMSNMFSDVILPFSLDVGGWDTSNVTDMSNMFSNVRGLKFFSPSAWDTSNVTDMSNMFSDCYDIEFLFLPFDTSKVTDMDSMFYNCHSLHELSFSVDVGGWDTSNVTDMKYMFASCTSLDELDLSSFDTSNVTDMRGMFASCTSLTTLTLGEGFGRTPSVKEIDFSWLGKWTDSSVQTLLTLYDRKANGLPTLTLKLSPATAEALGESGKTTLEGRGYAVEVESHDEGKTYLVC